MRRIDPAAWFRIRRLDDGVTWIDEPYIKEFYRCNLWHLRGRDRDLLVDSGWGVVSLRTHIPLVTEKPLVAVASHTHFDHIGGAPRVRRALGPRAEADVLAASHPTNTLVEPYVTDAVFDACRREPYHSTTYCPGPPRRPGCSTTATWSISATGCSRSSTHPAIRRVASRLFERATGILFSGDIVYDGPLIEDCPGADPDAYVRSLHRLLELPVRVMHGGHFPSCSGERLRQLIRAWLDHRAARWLIRTDGARCLPQRHPSTDGARGRPRALANHREVQAVAYSAARSIAIGKRRSISQNTPPKAEFARSTKRRSRAAASAASGGTPTTPYTATNTPSAKPMPFSEIGTKLSRGTRPPTKMTSLRRTWAPTACRTQYWAKKIVQIERYRQHQRAPQSVSAPGLSCHRDNDPLRLCASVAGSNRGSRLRISRQPFGHRRQQLEESCRREQYGRHRAQQREHGREHDDDRARLVG